MRVIRLISLLLMIVIVVACGRPLFAEEITSAGWEFSSPSGKISESVAGYSQKIIGLPTFEHRIDFELEQTLSNSFMRLQLAPWVSRHLTKWMYEFKEAWVEASTGGMDLRLGNQIFSWGAADQINPTDVWNPRDYSDPLQSVKHPITAIQLKIHPTQWDRFSAELIGAPFFRPSKLPVILPESGSRKLSVDESRWLLPLPSLVAGDGGFSAPLIYKTVAPTYSTSWQAGLRLKASRIGAWDFSLSGYSGVENIPRLGIEINGLASDPSLPILISLYPSFHRQEVLGIDGAGSFFDTDIGIRFEGAYYRKDNRRVKSAPAELQQTLWRDDAVQTVVGVDYTLKRKVLGLVHYFNAMYVHYQRIGSRENVQDSHIIGLPRTDLWNENIILYWEARYGSNLKFSSSTLVSLRDRGVLESPSIQYQFKDNLKLLFGGDLFFGRSTSVFGQFRDNSRGTFSVSYVF